MEKTHPTNTLQVRYHNDLNKVSMRDLSEVELNLFFAICSRVKNMDTEKVEFDYPYLRKISGYTSNSNVSFEKHIANVNAKLATIQYKVDNEKELTRYTLFRKFSLQKEEKKLVVSVDTECLHLFNEVGSHFTQYELQEFVSISGKYAKQLYCLLKQWRTVGKFYISLEDFKERFKVPDSYRLTTINSNRIKPAVGELNKKKAFSNLECTSVKKPGKKGLKVVGFEFTFDKEHRAPVPKLIQAPKTEPTAVPNGDSNEFEEIEVPNDFDPDYNDW